MATAYTHSIPTPPFSPQNYRMPDENTENPLISTINLLDSLVAFYQHERMWVYRTHAVLEDAFTPPMMDTAGITYSDPRISPSNTIVDPQYDGYNEAMGNPQNRQPASRWMRRKKGFKLRIDGIRAKRVINTQPVGQTQQSDDRPPREHILEMFEKMMEARMESCQRVNKLVREANRATVHYR
ncbi:hypothetical protein BDZ97DRAFT_1911623 [Flammula alnicola]|nr:hypothetical protein BDZ97DRAFT_1911623 [Flammula alnicola]